MTTAKQIRVLILLLVLAPLALLLFLEIDSTPGWERTLVVGIYPDNADGSEQAAQRIASLQSGDFLALEQYFTAQAQQHGLLLDRPFEFRLGEPIERSPPPPPAEHLTGYRIRWGAQLRWWHFRLNRQGLQPDIVLVLRFHGQDVPAQLQSIGMSQPRLALVNLVAAEQRRAHNQVIIAHELLHTVGASDLYGANFSLDFPQAYAQPDRQPRYPQPLAELMAMRMPITPELSRPPRGLEETRIGPTTAQEIGWQ